MLKRIFDIISSSFAIIVLSPFLIPVIIALKFSGEGYIFYTQKRIGRGGAQFDLLKFATMLKDSPNMTGGDITLGNDPRVLPFGRFLRKTKINELPQLFNIFKGDISVVGPRPLTPATFGYYTEYVKKNIIDLKPGLTGIGSIVFRDEESIISRSSKNHLDCYREDISPYKGELEIWYKNNQSFILDMKLIFLTAWVVLFSKSRLHEKMLRRLPAKPAALMD
jgi:lipopolysaccharide/colanic/teichoic acid biosynthesis glycosyltransferase